MNRKKSGVFIPRTSIYLWVIFMLLAIIALYELKIALPGFVLLVFLILYNIRFYDVRKKEINTYLENLTYNIDSASKDTLLNFPLPLVVVELDGTIIWYNSTSRLIFGDEKLFEKKIDYLVKDLNTEELGKQKLNISLNVEINYRHYRVMGNYVKTSDKTNIGSYILLLYFIDITDTIRLKEKYENEKTATGIIIIDNYDDLMQSVDESGPAQLLAEIEKKLSVWTAFTEGILKKFERDKYFFVFEVRHLKEMINKKFDILDSVKEINIGNKIPVTLSFGIGSGGKSLTENFNAAWASMDIALARGGDHVVIKQGTILNFFGGKTRELEKRTRVKARVMAYALRELIDQASEVFIMGHDKGDIDSLGACLGVYRIAKTRDKEAFIILNKSNSAIERLLKSIRDEEQYNDLFLGKTQALDRITQRTLIIVVDTHRPSFTECPELLDKADKVVVIDHHRRGAEFIKDPVLIYQETYASSTCELITEILQYLDDNIKLSSIEVEALYAGIVLDTSNFTFKTGVRTFEAASYLRKKGADTVSVKYLFQNDLETYKGILEVLKNTEYIFKGIASSFVPDNVKNPAIIAAKAADQLLNVTDIEAAFVICKIEGQVFISGRSLGELNVQAILEKLGGGGHMTVAGAQLEGISIKDALEMLKNAIIELSEEWKGP